MAPRHRFHGSQNLIAWVHREQVTNGWNRRLEPSHTAHTMLNLSDNFQLAVGLVDAKVGAELLHNRQKRDGLTKRQTATLEPGHGFPRCCQGPPEFEHEAGFADTPFPGH